MIYDNGSGLITQFTKYVSLVYVITFSCVNFYKSKICSDINPTFAATEQICDFKLENATGNSTESSIIIMKDSDGHQYGCRNGVLKASLITWKLKRDFGSHCEGSSGKGVTDNKISGIGLAVDLKIQMPGIFEIEIELLPWKLLNIYCNILSCSNTSEISLKLPNPEMTQLKNMRDPIY